MKPEGDEHAGVVHFVSDEKIENKAQPWGKYPAAAPFIKLNLVTIIELTTAVPHYAMAFEYRFLSCPDLPGQRPLNTILTRCGEPLYCPNGNCNRMDSARNHGQICTQRDVIRMDPAHIVFRAVLLAFTLKIFAVWRSIRRESQVLSKGSYYLLVSHFLIPIKRSIMGKLFQ